MKRSELKMLIKEALVEVLPPLLLRIEEYKNLKPKQKTLKSNISSAPKLIDKKKRAEAYEDIKEIRQQLPKIKESEDKVDITKGVGILDWFAKEGGPVVLESEFNHTDDDVDALLENVLKKNR
jgi:hypothetical protein